MKSAKILNTCAVVLLIIISSLTAVSSASAQAVQTFRPHEVIDAGNNLKIEILKCRGEGNDEEWEVIYYREKRQQGTRKWEKTSRIKELQNAANRTGIASVQIDADVKTIKDNLVKASVITSANKGNKTGEENRIQALEQNISDSLVTPSKNVIQVSKLAEGTTGKDTFTEKESGESSYIKDSINSKPSANAVPIKTDSHHTIPVYTLDKCFAIALDSNIGLQQARNNISSNIIDRTTAQYSLLPSVSYNLGHYFSFGKNIDPVTNTFVHETFSGGYTAAGLQLQLFSGFSRLNTIKQSAYLIEASEYAKKRTELELLTNISLTYARLLLDKEQLHIQRNSLQNIAAEIEVINEKIRVGRLSKYEFYTFNARLNSEQADLAAMQNDSLAALQDLRKLLNISYDKEVDIAAIDTTVLANIAATQIFIADVSNTVLKNHPAIKLAEMNEQAARLGEKIAKSNFMPSLSVGGNIVSNYNAKQQDIYGVKIPVDRQVSNNLGQNININLRIPIFSQLENINRAKKERINISNAQLAVRDATNTITTNMLQLINDFNTAKAKYKATSSAFVQNTLSYNLYSEKYRLGQISSVELLTAREILNISTSKYLQAKLQLFFQFRLVELLKRY